MTDFEAKMKASNDRIEILEKAMALHELMTYGWKRIKARLEYINNAQWQYLYPEQVAKAKRDNIITRSALDRIEKYCDNILKKLEK